MGHYATEKSYINYLIRETKKRCRYKNRFFDLNFDLYRKLLFGNCYFCGYPPVVSKRKENRFVNLATASVDRLDSSKGYTKSNTVSCCIKCNLMKRDYSEEEFVKKCEEIYEFAKKSKC